ncbi:MAG: hypothetical protein AAF252_00680 [Pseudomonadota bacterium]
MAILCVVQFAPATPVNASPSAGYDEAPLIVKNDHGGLLWDRLHQIKELRAQGRPIEIRGKKCYSTCTMLMGLPNTCISPKTVFGFHGPSSYGRSLDKATFERASEVIASYYPEPLQVWYMAEARHTIKGVIRVRGDNIIQMGIRSCDAGPSEYRSASAP